MRLPLIGNVLNKKMKDLNLNRSKSFILYKSATLIKKALPRFEIDKAKLN